MKRVCHTAGSEGVLGLSNDHAFLLRMMMTRVHPANHPYHCTPINLQSTQFVFDHMQLLDYTQLSTIQMRN